MITLIFETHSTSFDNEAGLASGHNDVALSPAGIAQAKSLGARYANQQLAAIYCSDMQRAYKTAEIAFGDRFPIVRDARLRECNYGTYTQQPADIVKEMKPKCITQRFPEGESYEETTARVVACLREIAAQHQDGETVMLIGHRATQYGIEHLINGISVAEAVSAPWQWQPGWHYLLKPAERI